MSYVVYLISYFAAGDSLRSSTPFRGDHSFSGAGYAASSLSVDTDGSTIPGYHLQNN